MAKTPAVSAKPKAAPRTPKPTDPLAPVTAAERGLLAAVKADRRLNATPLSKGQRVVRSAFFRALLAGRIPAARPSERGLEAVGLIFKDQVDLSHIREDEGPLPYLHLESVVFESGVSFANSHVRGLYIIKSEARAGINLGWLKTDGDLWLDQTSCINGLYLGGANIGGVISLEGAKLKGSVDAAGIVSGVSLQADGLVTVGGIFCRCIDGVCFESEGEIRLLAATIGGTLELDGAKLKGAMNPELGLLGPCLSADGMSLRGDLFCRNFDTHRFEAQGELRLLGASVGGDFSLQGAKLCGATDAAGAIRGPSLSADRLSVVGGVFCRSIGDLRFEAKGEIRLPGATVGGTLEFAGAKLKGLGDALLGHRMVVGDVVVLHKGFEAEGSVIFQGAKLSDLIARGTFRSDWRAMDLSDATMRRLVVDLTAESRGEVVLEGATAETLDAFHPRRWGSAPAQDSGVKLDLDGFTYRRAEISNDALVRTRIWAKFFFRVPIAENVLEVLDRGFEGCAPKRNHFYPQPFEQAAKVLRDMGHGRAADDVAVAKREFERVCKANDGLSRLLALLHMVFFRYGYGPMRAGLWTLFFLGAGWASYAFYQADSAMIVIGSIPKTKLCTQAPWAMALDTFLPLVDLHVEDKCRFKDDYVHGALAEVLRVGYSLVGLVFIPMVTLTFAGVFRKD